MDKNETRSRLFPGGGVHPLMVAVLVGGAFFIGSLWTKVQYLEKGVGGTAGAVVANQPQAAAPAAPQAALKAPTVSKEDHVRGNKNAKVVLVNYSDYECPFCKQFHPTMQQVMKEYGDKVQWIYRHYPLSFHANAQKAAEAAECVGKSAGTDAFWKFTDLYFERTTSGGTGIALTALADIGAEAGANKANVQKCLDSGEMTKKVQDQMAAGTAEGVSGTPGTIIVDAKGNTQLIPGALPFDQVKPMIDAALSN